MAPKVFLTNPEGDVYEEFSSSLDFYDLAKLASLPPVQEPGPTTQTALFGNTSFYEITTTAHPGDDALSLYESQRDLYQLSVPFEGSSYTPRASLYDSIAPSMKPSDLGNFSFEQQAPVAMDNDNLPMGAFNMEQFIATAHSGTLPPSTNHFSFEFSHHGPGLPSPFVTGQTPPSSPSSLYHSEWQHHRTDLERSAPIGSPTNRSAHSSPSLGASSVPESPSLYTPSSHFNHRQGFPFFNHPFSYREELPGSPGSADVDFRHSHETDGTGFSAARGRQPSRSIRRHQPYNTSASRSPSASGSARIRRESCSPVSERLTESIAKLGLNARARRAFSGPQGTLQPSDSLAANLGPPFPSPTQISRGGRVSDSYLQSLPPPNRDDTGRMSKAEMWSLAQSTETFDEEFIEEEPPDPVAGPAPKELVASSALVLAATSRRKIEATHFCTFSGCKASFTAKHNLQRT
ncbi:hypothetical protein BT96DRAFT_716651 [Gymnopus androsaceus JB14]|uniref:Uncharacterized protein n=1 Tax=Gymnopus androsaceus JB14 TaxID=1447944 RepID=A0A6A4HJ07_9AGAR|nr:hypothetical protein BT96DRAFT_716651 [Gymnopus androsaceus JB14]